MSVAWSYLNIAEAQKEVKKERENRFSLPRQSVVYRNFPVTRASPLQLLRNAKISRRSASRTPISYLGKRHVVAINQKLALLAVMLRLPPRHKYLYLWQLLPRNDFTISSHSNLTQPPSKIILHTSRQQIVNLLHLLTRSIMI